MSQSRCYTALRSMGEGYHTIKEIADATCLGPGTIKPRMRELYKLGVVDRRKADKMKRVGMSGWAWAFCDLCPSEPMASQRGRVDASAEARQFAELSAVQGFAPHVVGYLQTLADMYQWCEERGLDFRQQMNQAMTAHMNQHTQPTEVTP
ncbi:MAG: hypothetical protein AAGA29_05945 [Planctomycetota bacterium]